MHVLLLPLPRRCDHPAAALAAGPTWRRHALRNSHFPSLDAGLNLCLAWPAILPNAV